MSTGKKLIKAPRNLPQGRGDIEISGDRTVDGLFVEAFDRLDEDRREADDLYEMIRQNAEMSPDDPQMAMTAVQALRVKQNTTGQAIRVVDIAARYKIQKEKLDMAREDDEGELLDLIDEGIDEPGGSDEDNKESKETEKGSEVEDEDRGRT